jgi:hypothetical protein
MEVTPSNRKPRIWSSSEPVARVGHQELHRLEVALGKRRRSHILHSNCVASKLAGVSNLSLTSATPALPDLSIATHSSSAARPGAAVVRQDLGRMDAAVGAAVSPCA